MKFSEVPTFDNIKSTNEYLQIGNRFVKNISYVDVENIDLPSEIEPYSILGGNGAASETAVDNFTFSSTNWKIMKRLFIIRLLPFHYKHHSKGNSTKKEKARRSSQQFSIMPSLQKKFKHYFIISLLMDNSL